MKKGTCLLLCAALVLALSGCTVGTAGSVDELRRAALGTAEETEPPVETTATPAPVSAEPVEPEEDPVVYYADHPEIPDLGEMLGYELFSQTETDGFDCYYYRLNNSYGLSGRAALEQEFAVARAAYSDLCTELGYAPDYAVSGTLTLLVRFETDAVLLAGIAGTDADGDELYYLSAIVADIDTMDASMDDPEASPAPTETSEEPDDETEPAESESTPTPAPSPAVESEDEQDEPGEELTWKELIEKATADDEDIFEALAEANPNADPIWELGAERMEESAWFFTGSTTADKAGFREAGYAMGVATTGTDEEGIQFIQGRDSDSVTRRYAIDYTPGFAVGMLTYMVDEETVMIVSVACGDGWSARMVYDAQEGIVMRMLIAGGNAWVGWEETDELPEPLTRAVMPASADFIDAMENTLSTAD